MSHRNSLVLLESQESRQLLQIMRRDFDNECEIKLHHQLMETHKNNIGQVSNVLKKANGKSKTSLESIETLVGTFNNENVLEGFRANTEKLCSPREDLNNFCNEFYKACLEDNMIIFDLTAEEEVCIP